MSQKALIYARFSSAEQAKGYSLERQVKHGEGYVEAQGWTLERTITDEGRSAYKGDNRAEGSALHTFEIEARAGLHSGKVLCVENLDRLSRQGAKAAAQLIWSLNEAGVSVATWHDSMIYRADGGSDMMELFSVIVKSQLAYEESLKKGQRTQASWDKRHGEITRGSKSASGRCPDWLTCIDGEYVVDEHRAQVANEIYDLYIAGAGVTRIAQILNERGEPGWSYNSDGWYTARLRRLLTNRAVLGEYWTKAGEQLSADHYPQIVSAEKFNRAQAVRASKMGTGGESKSARNILRSLVRCNCCGGSAVYELKSAGYITYKRKSDGGTSRYFKKECERLSCDSNIRKNGCDNKTRFDYLKVEKAVFKELLVYTVDDRVGVSPALTKLRDDLAELERQITANDKKLSNIVDAIAEGGAKALVKRASDLEGAIDQQRAQKQALVNAIAIEEAKPSARNILDQVRDQLRQLDSDDYEERYLARTKTNAALRQLGARIYLDRDHFTLFIDSEDPWLFDTEGNLIKRLETWTETV